MCRELNFPFSRSISRRMYRYDVEESSRLVIATFGGVVTDGDVFDYLAHMLSHTSYGRGWSTLIDLSAADTVNVTTAGVQRMRALPLYMEERLHGAKVAILAPAGTAAHDKAVLYKTMGARARYEIEVFSDRDEAMRWLLPGAPGAA